MRFSRLQNQIYSVLLSVALIFAPAREAKAFAPAIYGVYAAASAMGTVGAADLFAGALAIGAGFGLLLVSTPAGDQARLPLTSAPANVPAAPAAAPSTTPQSVLTYVNGGGTFNSFESACQGVAVYMNNARNQTYVLSIVMKSAVYPSCVITTNCVPYSCSGGDTIYSPSSLGAQTVMGCPVGYTLVSGVCNLTDARAATPDNKCDYSRAGSALSVISDPDCASPTKAPVTCIAGVCSGVGLSPAGEPISYIITPTPDGGSVVQTFKQGTTSGTTTVTSGITTVGPDSTVVATSSTTTTGSINTDTGVVTTGPVVPPTAPPATITFPTDYNREATQTQIRDSLSTQGMPIDVATQAQTDLANAQGGRDQFKTDIQGIPSAVDPVISPSLFQPFQPSTCSPLAYTFGSSMTAGSHTVTLDLCPWVPTIQRIGAWGMYLLTAAMLFQMFTRRPDGSA